MKRRKKKLKKYGDQLLLQLMEHKVEPLEVECLEEVCLEWVEWEECQIWAISVEDHHHHPEVIHLDLKLMKLIKVIIYSIFMIKNIIQTFSHKLYLQYIP